MRLGKFRKLTKDLPDSAIISYHGYDTGPSGGNPREQRAHLLHLTEDRDL